MRSFLLFLILAVSFCKHFAALAQPSSMTFSNGVQLIYVPFPGSTNISIFTFLPMGLAGDPPGRAQWAHLVEHLVIRSTTSEQFRAFNAETLADHMRLDFYGSTSNWREGLEHHRRWLEGVPFEEKSLAAEKPKIVSECDFTVRNLATHKFALAAWNQAYRYEASSISLKGDVLAARLEDVQQYRDQRLFIPQRTSICIAGGISFAEAKEAAQQAFANLVSTAKPPSAVNFKTGNKSVRWDLAANHLVLTWPIPEPSKKEYAALMVFARILSMKLYSDPKFSQFASMPLTGTDLITPEGNFFYLSAALKKGGRFDDLKKEFLRVCANSLGLSERLQVGAISRQLAGSLMNLPNPKSLAAQSSPGMTPAMLEANIALQWALAIHRYQDGREKLAFNISQVSYSDIQDAVSSYLNPAKATHCEIHSSP